VRSEQRVGYPFVATPGDKAKRTALFEWERLSHRSNLRRGSVAGPLVGGDGLPTATIRPSAHTNHIGNGTAEGGYPPGTF
jgi:hypothetical protein